MKIKSQRETFLKIIEKMDEGKEEVSVEELTFLSMMYNKRIFALLLCVLVIIPAIIGTLLFLPSLLNY